MEQLPLIVDDYEEAIRQTAYAMGFKDVAHALRPDLKVDAAARWLSDCCNPDRERYELSLGQLGQLRRMARQAGVHILAVFEARDAGYADPKPIEPEDERAAIQREFVVHSKALQELAARIDRLASQ
jgi:hypothetical protein